MGTTILRSVRNSRRTACASYTFAPFVDKLNGTPNEILTGWFGKIIKTQSIPGLFIHADRFDKRISHSNARAVSFCVADMDFNFHSALS